MSSVCRESLARERQPHWTHDYALAFSLLHDVRVSPCGLTASREVSPNRSEMTRFGVGEAAWHPYGAVQPSRLASAGLSESEPLLAESDEWPVRPGMLVVSSLADDQTATAHMTADFRQRGVAAKTARGALNGEALTHADGRPSVPLQPMRTRLVWVR